MDTLRIFLVLKLGKLAGKVLGRREVPRDAEIERLRDALGEITTLLDYRHAACQVAIRALGDHPDAWPNRRSSQSPGRL